MKTPRLLLATCLLGVSFTAQSQPQTLIDETFDAGYQRLVQNIAGGNLAVYQSRSGTTVGGPPGLSFTGTSSSSQQYAGYFTDAGANAGAFVQNGHVTLGVGASLTASFTFKLATVPAGTGYSLRLGLFNDAGTRQTADLTGGGSSAAFANNPGYAVFLPLSADAQNNIFAFRNRTNTVPNGILATAADYESVGSTSGGALSGLAANTDYTLSFTIERQTDTTARLSASLTDAATAAVLTSGSRTQTGGPLTSEFSWFAWRVNTATAGGTITFSEIKVEAVPEPSSFAIVGLGLVSLMAARRRRA